MRKVHCEGCGMTEPEDLARPSIKPVTFTVVLDPRPNMPNNIETHEADLCPDCRGRLLHNYFGVDAKGQLDLPAFIEPQSLRVVEEGR